MKTIGALVFLAVISTADATVLRDLTPGGTTDPNAEFNTGLLTASNRGTTIFFDQAALPPFSQGPPRWINNGILNGGTTFLTDLLTVGPTPNATISWDFSNLTGYSMTWIELVTQLDGAGLKNIYHVNHNFQTNSGGNVNVTLNGQENIQLIVFFGRTPFTVPEPGTSFLLLAISLGAVGILQRRGLHSRAS